MSVAWTTSPSGADWDAAVELLHAADRPVLLAHVSPDGDALGSALAVALGLRRLGKHPVVSFGDDPFEVPRILRFLPGLDMLAPPAEVDAEPELLVTFDASSIDRLGLLVDNVKAAREVVAVDHHASYTGFGDIHLVETAVPATAVLAHDMLLRLGVGLDAEIATALYTGLITDTGSFRYAATSPETHEFAALLLATGMEHDRVARRIYDSAPFGYVQVLGAALTRAQLEPAAVGGLGLVWTVVSAGERLEHGLGMDAVEPIIDSLRVAEEAEVAVVLKEHEDGSLRVSTRARGAIDMSEVCLALGGGGHRYAAGFTSHDDVDTTIEKMRVLLDAAPHMNVPRSSV